MPDGSLHDALGIEIAQPALVAAVGGGGKTTILFALARERAASPPPVADAVPPISVLTTTTKFTVPSFAKSWPLVLGASAASRSAAIEHAWIREQPAVVVGTRRLERERIRGVSLEWPVDALQSDIVGFVGVEADGSAGRPFKAPADHEPVIPHHTSHVLAVVGVQILSKPLDAQHVHRPEQVRALTDAEPGAPITAALVAAVLGHPQGGRKNIADAKFRVIVSSAQRDPNGAESIAAACHEAGIDWVIAYDAQSDVARRL
jgi:probable selenium-dependent hydroxylase accessory protein YqeC